jgi:hypothetical protein
MLVGDFTQSWSGGFRANPGEIVMDGDRFHIPRTGGLVMGFHRYFLLLIVLLATAVVPGADHPAVAQELFVDPSISLPSELVFTVDIAIDCAGQEVKGVETILAFDPILLILDAVTPGPWFSGTGLDYYFFDYTAIEPQGTIHFASSVLDGSNNQSLTIAVCHFTALGFGTTPLIFQDVDVRGPNNLDLGFGHSTGDLVHIDQAVPVTTTSYGRLKALFR